MHDPRDLGPGRERGRIKSFNTEKGFGFIDCPKMRDKYGRDVFIHKKQMGDLEVGDEITFVCEPNKEGMPQARDITLTDGTRPEGASDVAAGNQTRRGRGRNKK